MINAAKARPVKFQGRVQDLLDLLVEMLPLHDSLVETAQRKLQAMRRCDLQQMEDCLRREATLTATIRDRETARRRLMEAIGADLGLSRVESQAMSVSQLAVRLDENRSLKLRAMARQLAAVLEEIARVNRAVTLFAREMLDHYRFVFNEVTKGFAEAPVYVSSGRPALQVQARVFDMTG